MGDRREIPAVRSVEARTGRGVRSTKEAARRSEAKPTAAWSGIRDRLRAHGLRWTPQRRTLVEVLAATSGHVTGAELVERCRAVDPSTIPSTVYRTLAVLEGLGLVWHGHGPDGREEFHVRPIDEHGHLHCRACGRTVEIGAEEGAAVVAAIEEQTGFRADLSHVTIVGRCAECRAEGEPRQGSAGAAGVGEAGRAVMSEGGRRAPVPRPRRLTQTP